MSDLPNFDAIFSLAGKTALVTGGSRGLGLHMATGFLRAGAALVVVTARRREGLDQAVARLNALAGVSGGRGGGRAVGLAADVGRSEDIVRLVGEVAALLGGARLDILVCNAGASWGSRFEDAPPAASVKILDLNVRGVFELVQQSLPLLSPSSSSSSAAADDPARVLIVSSTAGTTVPHVGAHGTIMYSASKAAAHHLGRNLAVELGPRRITANVLAPGFFPSKLAQGLIRNLGGEAALARDNPLGRLGRPEDVAALAVFLCSAGGKYINGEDISLDGGARLSAGRMTKL